MGEGSYIDGKVDGPFTEWHENGQIEREGRYMDDKEDGLWIIFNENGKELIRFTYEDNVTIFH